MAGKQTRKLVPIPADPSGGWHLLVSGAAFIQNVDTEPIYFVFSDVDPSTLSPRLTIEDAHSLKHEQDDNYVNDFGDTLWVWKQPAKASRIAVTLFP